MNTAAFEEHPRYREAKFVVSGNRTSTFGWAHLLHALDIHPGHRIVIWRRAKPSEDPLLSDFLSLELDGQSLSHIINPHAEVENPGRFRPFNSAAFSSTSVYTLCFAKLDIDLSEDICTVSYHEKPGIFPCEVVPYHKENDLLERYHRTLDHGMSDNSVVLPDCRQPLKKRIDALLKIKDHSRSGQVYMVTSSWLEQASRIKRRVTTNGGKDNLLQEGLIRLMCQDPTVARAGSMENVRSIIQDLFMYSNTTFTANQGRPRHGIQSRTSPSYLEVLIDMQMVRRIEELGVQLGGTWISELSTMVSDVKHILYLRGNFSGVRGLICDTKSRIWNSRCRVLG